MDLDIIILSEMISLICELSNMTQNNKSTK